MYADGKYHLLDDRDSYDWDEYMNEPAGLDELEEDYSRIRAIAQPEEDEISHIEYLVFTGEVSKHEALERIQAVMQRSHLATTWRYGLTAIRTLNFREEALYPFLEEILISHEDIRPRLEALHALWVLFPIKCMIPMEYMLELSNLNALKAYESLKLKELVGTLLNTSSDKAVFHFLVLKHEME